MTDRAFRIEVQARDARVEARLFGELTMEADGVLKNAFAGADLAGRPAVQLDFTSVPYVDSMGVAALIGAIAYLRDRTSGIRFVGLNRHLDKVFRMTGFPSLVAM